MNVAQLDKELEVTVSKYHIYGIECVLKSLVRASTNEQSVTRAYLQYLVGRAWEAVEKESEQA